MKKPSKLQVILVIIILLILGVIFGYLYLANKTYTADKDITYGVTFSKNFAKFMKLDWKETYIAMLDDLKVKHIRIPTYWADVEPERDLYVFEDIDWMINEASKRNASVILVVGRRQPRWPECHDPVWVQEISDKGVREELLENIKLVVNRYKDNPIIEMWQVENEPFLDFFGECPKMTKSELQEEIDLVRSLDKRKILITDSGELSTWYPTIKMGDVFGTTLYRTTWNKYIGYWDYFFVPPSYYRIKGYLWGKAQESSFVAELQAEPWFPNSPLETALPDHYKSMDAKKLVKNAEYAKKTNFLRAYFWGVEWWYWLKTTQGDGSVWEAARNYF